MLFQCIETSQSFVVDNTNPTAEDRQRYIVPAKAAGYSVTGYYFSSSLSQCIARNELREGKARVPVKAIKAITNKMKLPRTEEGFDYLFVVILENGEYSIYDWTSGL